jgi:hypothetical protein
VNIAPLASTTTLTLSTTTSLPEPEPIVPDAPITAPAQLRTVWDDLADCEPDTGRGRLNWLDRIWERHRGDAPSDPNQATWPQEIVAAQRLLVETGGRYTAWAGCAQRLGLPFR